MLFAPDRNALPVLQQLLPAPIVYRRDVLSGRVYYFDQAVLRAAVHAALRFLDAMETTFSAGLPTGSIFQVRGPVWVCSM